jgi:hypothetical protein
MKCKKLCINKTDISHSCFSVRSAYYFSLTCRVLKVNVACTGKVRISSLINKKER